MNIRSRRIVEIDPVDLLAGKKILLHPRTGNDEVQLIVRMFPQFIGIARRTRKVLPAQSLETLLIDLLHGLLHFKQPRPAGNPVRLERR